VEKEQKFGAKGLWCKANDDVYSRYHTSYCALIGLMDMEFNEASAELETDVGKCLPRPLQKLLQMSAEEAPSTAKPTYKMNQQIEVRYQGKNRYYPGKISKVNSFGKYDVLYDDGESEKGIDASLIRCRK
jgi:hypothetical protein